jgi:hypothetical protein
MNIQHYGKSSVDVKPNSSSLKCRQKDTSFVQLEIQVGALRRLIARHSLMIKEVHCPNDESKSIIRQALLDSLADAIG